MNAAGEKSQSESRHTLQALRGMFNPAVDNNLIVKSPVPVSMKAGGASTKDLYHFFTAKRGITNQKMVINYCCLRDYEKEKPLKLNGFKGFSMVRPAGLEPVAFRVGV